MSALDDINRTWFEYLETVKTDILATMRAQGRDATGQASSSLRVVQNQFLKPQLRGVEYFKYLQSGVGSQPKSVSRQLIDNIEIWADAKGIEVDPFAVAISLTQKGTAIKRGQPGVNINQIIRDNLPEALKETGQRLTKSFKDQMKVSSGR